MFSSALVCCRFHDDLFLWLWIILVFLSAWVTSKYSVQPIAELSLFVYRAFKYLSRQVSLPSILYDLSEHYEVNSLVFPLVKRLVPAAFKQAALNVVSSDSSDNDDDNPPLRLMTLLQELLTWLPLENNTAMFIAR